MGRLIAIIVGGAALAFYLPFLLPKPLESVGKMWVDLLGPEWYLRITTSGAGLVAGLGLILFAVRGRE